MIHFHNLTISVIVLLLSTSASEVNQYDKITLICPITFLFETNHIFVHTF